LKKNKVVQYLIKIATDKKILMDKAGQLLSQNMPEEFTFLKKKEKYKSLKQIINSTDIFDIEEKNNKLYFKVKSNYEQKTHNTIDITLNIRQRDKSPAQSQFLDISFEILSY
jgi:hypothetical protein